MAYNSRAQTATRSCSVRKTSTKPTRVFAEVELQERSLQPRHLSASSHRRPRSTRWMAEMSNGFPPVQHSTQETNGRGENDHEGNRCDGPGRGNGWDEAGGTTRAEGSDKRRRGPGSCVGMCPD